MKKTLALILALVLALSILTGCGQAGSSPSTPAGADKEDGPVTIRIAMMNSESEIAGWEAMIQAANEKLAAVGEQITIEIQKINASDWPEYYQKVAAEMAAGNAPDLGRVAESFMPTLIDRGQVIDLTEHVQKDLDQSQYFMKTFENAAFVDGKYFGLPSGLYNYVLYYNKDLFDAAGVAYPSSDWNNPSSFEEIEEMAAKLSMDVEGGRQYGFFAGPYMAEVGMFSKALGGSSVFDDEGNPIMNSAITKQVYNWFDRMLKAGSMPTPAATDIMDSMTMFTNDRLAMTVDGTWFLGMMGGLADSMNIGIAAVPGAKGSPAYTSQFVDSFVMFTGTPHQEAAWKALAAIISREGFEALAATGVGGIPVQREVSNQVTDNLLGEKFSEEGKNCAKNSLDFTLKVPYNAYYQQADERVNNMMGEWMLGQISPDVFAEQVQQILLDFKADSEKG